MAEKVGVKTPTDGVEARSGTDTLQGTGSE